MSKESTTPATEAPATDVSTETTAKAEQFETVFVNTPEELVDVPHSEKAREFKITHGKKVYYTWGTQGNSMREAFARKILNVTVEALNPRKRAAATPAEKTLNAIGKLSVDEQRELMEKLKAQLLGSSEVMPDKKNQPGKKAK